jgi:hypothetical protein
MGYCTPELFSESPHQVFQAAYHWKNPTVYAHPQVGR